MRELWRLTAYEYKKIFLRKSTWMALLLALFAATFCMVGNLLMGSDSVNGGSLRSSRELLGEEREAVHRAAGYFDEVMIGKVIEGNRIARETLTDAGVYPDEVYRAYVQPYASLRSKVAQALCPIGEFDFARFDRLESAEGVQYYQLLSARLTEIARRDGYSPGETALALQKLRAVPTPYYYDFCEGYVSFLLYMSTSAVFLLFAQSVCLAPIFADEYQRRTDALLLCARFGKTRLIQAKILTTITFSLLFTGLGLAVALLTTLSAYSPLGAGASFQIWRSFSLYPITMLQAVLIFCGVIFCAALLFAGVSLVLSAYQNAFFALMASAMLLFGSLFVGLPPRLRLLNYLLPAKMVDAAHLFPDRQLYLLGAYIEPYLLVPYLCLLLLLLLLPLARRGFRRHQIG